jgi:transposase
LAIRKTSYRKLKSYSLDLRKKIIKTYENGPISQRNLAKHFRLALCEALHEQTKAKVSEPTMCRVLKRLNLTPKKSLHPSDKESEWVQR